MSIDQDTDSNGKYKMQRDVTQAVEASAPKRSNSSILNKSSEDYKLLK